ncbi:hypothetical protein ABK040_016244 [Willaertia magna]
MSLIDLPTDLHIEILLFCNELDLYFSISRLSTYWRKLIELNYKEFFTTKFNYYYLQNYLLETAKDLTKTSTNMTETSYQSTINVMKIIMDNKIFNNLLLYGFIKLDNSLNNKEELENKNSSSGLLKYLQNLFITTKNKEEKIINNVITNSAVDTQFSNFKLIKISMIGGPKVGKSAFFDLLKKGTFKETIYIPTTITEFTLKRYQLQINTNNNQNFIQNFKIQLWDMPRREILKVNLSAESTFKGTNCFLFFFDLTNENSLNYLENSFYVLNSMNAFGLLVGTKCDLLNERKVNHTEKAKKLSKQIGIPYLEISLVNDVDLILIYFILIKHLYSSPQEANWFK